MEGEEMEERIMTKYEVMKYLNISRRYFERLVEEGQLYSPRKRATMKSRRIKFRDYEDQQVHRESDHQVLARA